MPTNPTDPSDTTTGEAGSESNGLLLRRVIALTVDWAIATAISAGFFDFNSWATLAVFAGMTLIMLMTAGATLGHRLASLRVYRWADGASPPYPHQALIRTLALCLVIPAVVWDRSGRGLHDVWAGTVMDRWGLRPIR